MPTDAEMGIGYLPGTMDEKLAGQIRAFATQKRYTDIRPILAPYVNHENSNVRHKATHCLLLVEPTIGRLAFREQQHTILRMLGGFGNAHVDMVMKAIAKVHNGYEKEFHVYQKMFLQGMSKLSGWKEADSFAMWRAVSSDYCLTKHQAITVILRDAKLVKQELLPDQQPCKYDIFAGSPPPDSDFYKFPMKSDLPVIIRLLPPRSGHRGPFADVNDGAPYKAHKLKYFEAARVPYIALREAALALNKDPREIPDFPASLTWDEAMQDIKVKAYCLKNPEVLLKIVRVDGTFPGEFPLDMEGHEITVWLALTGSAHNLGKDPLEVPEIPKHETWEQAWQRPEVQVYCRANPDVAQEAGALFGRRLNLAEPRIRSTFPFYTAATREYENAMVQTQALKEVAEEYNVCVVTTQQKQIDDCYQKAMEMNTVVSMHPRRSAALDITEISKAEHEQMIERTGRDALTAEELEQSRQEVLANRREQGSWDYMATLSRKRSQDCQEESSAVPFENPACFVVLSCGDHACQFKDSMFDMTLDLTVTGTYFADQQNQIDIEVWKGELKQDEDGEQMDWTHTLTYRYHGLSRIEKNSFRFTRLEEIKPTCHMSVTTGGPLTTADIARAKEV